MTRRTERLNHLLRQEITELLQREAKDPRLAVMVSVTRVSVSADLHYAKVFVSVMGTEEEKKGLLAGSACRLRLPPAGAGRPAHIAPHSRADLCL